MANDRPRQTPGPPGRSARRSWLLAGAVSVAAHLAVLLPVMLARGGPPPVWPVAEPPPVMVTLFRPPPPRPEPAPDPAPASPAPTPAAASAPAKARPVPPAPTPRPSRALVPPPPEVETVAARVPAPPAPMATLSDAQLAGATTAGPGAGAGGSGGSGGGGGDGAGTGGCDMVRRLQDALRDDPEVRAAVVRAQRDVGPGRTLLLWNGDWIRNPGEAGEGLAGVRQAVAMEVAFAPDACRARSMRGLVLISFSEAPGGARLALGKGAWRWGDMLRGR